MDLKRAEIQFAPTDIRNADDILSPYYKQKGMFRQNLDDMFEPLNKQDPTSPYYDPFNSFS